MSTTAWQGGGSSREAQLPDGRTRALTELGVIRVCAQLPLGARSPRATVDALLQFRVSTPGHGFWPDAVSPAVTIELRQAETARQGTDRYLLGLARRFEGAW
jgi:hypothetical protein